MNQVQNIFVYGSLTEGMVHYGRVQEFVKTIRPATIQAYCYRLPVGYPALIEPEVASVDAAPSAVISDVPGQVLEIEARELVFKILDEFHGFNPIQIEKSLFYKKEVEVLLSEGERLAAHCYFLNPSKLPAQSQALTDGDWMKSLSTQPALPHQLSEAQVTYIKRLGASTGREIVPIDLGLYRELMKLELIVDKGRRLALTKLGKDVYKYLS